MTAEPYTRIIEQKAIAGNAAFSQVVPSGVVWEIYAVEVKMVTDATVANRLCTLTFKDAVSGDLLFSARIGPAHAASLTRNYSYAPGLADATAFIDTTNLTGVIPWLKLCAGNEIRVVFTAGVAGDAFEVRLVVEEKPTNI